MIWDDVLHRLLNPYITVGSIAVAATTTQPGISAGEDMAKEE